MATRRERVVLDLEDNFTAGMARVAAAATLGDEAIKRLGGTSASTDRQMRPLGEPGGSIDRTGTSSRTTSAEIDKLSGRMRVMADVAAILGPGLIPIAAVGVPAVAGLATELGAAALAAGTAVLAFHGVGTALSAVNKAALDPTVTNLKAAQLAMENLTPAARDFVTQLQAMRPQFQALQQAAAAGLFPGLERGLANMQSALPEVEQLLFNMGQTLGNLGADAGKALGGAEWAGFITFFQREAPLALSALARSIGDVAHGTAELFMAFSPLNHGFADWMLQAADSFDKWASGLSKTKGFQDFVNYLQQNGPLVAEALGSIGNALLQIVEASAPLGGPVLHALAAVADVIAKLADSNAGPAIMATVTALALLNRVSAAGGAMFGPNSSYGKATAGVEGLGNKVNALRPQLIRGGIALGGLGLAATGVAGKFGLANTATLAMMGTIAGPWGAAVGGAVGLLLDLAGSQHKVSIDAATLTSTLNQQTGAITGNTKAYAAKQLVDSGVLEDAQSLGLSLSQVTQAALGNETAIRAVSDALAGYQHEAANKTGGRITGLTDQMNMGAAAANRQADAADNVRQAIGDTNGKLTEAQRNIKLFGLATESTVPHFQHAASAAQQFRQAVEDVNKVLARRASLRDYQAALDDFTKSVKKNGDTLDITTRKGRDNQASLDNIAAKAISVAQAMHGTNRVEFLTQARKDFVDATAKILGGRDAAKAFFDRLGLLDKQTAKPEIIVDTGNADRATQHVTAELNAIDGKVSRAQIVIETLHIDHSGTSYQHGSGGTSTVGGSGGGGGGGTTKREAAGYDSGGGGGGGGGTTGIVPRMSASETMRKDAAAGALLRNMTGGGGPGGGSGGGGNLPDALKGLRDRLKESQAALKKESDQRDALRQKAQAVASGIRSGLASDLWAGGNVWGAGGGLNPIGVLNADKARTKRLIAAIRTLRSKGLTGPALADIIQTGDVERAEYMASLPKSILNTYETDYRQRQRLINQAAQLGGNVTYGNAADSLKPDIHALAQTVRHLEHALKIALKKHSDRNHHDHQGSGHRTAGALDHASGHGKKRGGR